MLLSRVWMVCLQAYAIKNGLESWFESWTWKTLHVPVLPRCWKQLAVGSRFAHLPSLLARLHRVCPWTLCQQCYWLHLCQRSTNLRNFTFDGMTFFMTLLSQGHPKLPQFEKCRSRIWPVMASPFFGFQDSSWADPEHLETPFWTPWDT